MVLSIFLTNANTVFGMYDVQIGRFTTRDPISGNPQEPMSLHKYLYCLNDPMNCIDPLGLTSLPEEEAVMGADETIEEGGDGMALSLLQRVRGFVKGIEYEQKVVELGTKSDYALEVATDEVTEIHHIAWKGWGNLSKFGKKLLENPLNKIKLPKSLHGEITRFFNRGANYYKFLEGKGYGTLQEYVSTLDWEQQLDWDFKALGYLLENETMEGFSFVGLPMPGL